jgi:hypothetical protein
MEDNHFKPTGTAAGGDVRIKDLPEEWQDKAGGKRTIREYQIRLPIHVAAGIGALADMYPGRTQAQIITDLLSAALFELEEAFPYIQGKRVVAEDEFGDPMYEDVGPTPRFDELMRKHARLLKAELEKG